MTCCPSAAPFGLTLGPDFPWADDPSPGTLVLTAKKILTSFIVTHAGIRTSVGSTTPCGMASLRTERSPTRRSAEQIESIASVDHLSPDHFRRIVTRPVSYYALFEGWLLLSQPPGCLCDDTSLTTERLFGDLSWRSGLFPSWLRKLALAASLPDLNTCPFGV